MKEETILVKAEDIEKSNRYFQIMNMWLEMEIHGIHVGDYLKINDVKRVAIYGMKELGERLFDSLKKSSIVIDYVIDVNPYIVGDFDLYGPDEELPDTEMIIVTPFYYIDEISNTLIDKVNSNTIVVGLDYLLGQAFHRYI